MMTIPLRILLIGILLTTNAMANEVEIVTAKLERNADNTWTVSVSLLHEDNGWDHYADKWQLVDSDGAVLGERILLHPHDNEQPFERSTSGIQIPEGVKVLYLEAHDIVHGWSDKRLEIDLTKASKLGQLTVFAELNP